MTCVTLRTSRCITGPSAASVMGFGRSRTMKGMPFFAASSMAIAIVHTKVYGRAPTSWMSYRSTSTFASSSAVGRCVRS